LGALSLSMMKTLNILGVPTLGAINMSQLLGKSNGPPPPLTYPSRQIEEVGGWRWNRNCIIFLDVLW
jgi:hypothetical protein